ncbi:hypothetical protein JOD31_000371 [Methylopila capsulata]|uniref:Uncharacterized protein n=1 Tax=Methylopila capsulata TaxID=61654 RepID=A0A9W6MRY9_9HYPH|nr:MULTISPECIES: hypothetical protein [Methylopila]MBM7850159.1 hypothetical protein [Methylopila capsulata]GLK55451.1 hypothetical protein GCM10008170_14700 [Methylopila capsulata]
MSLDTRQLYESSTGDSWHLVRDNDSGEVFVRHLANKASGGSVRDVGLGVFLTLGRDGPEHQEVWRLISSLIPRAD